MFCEERSGQLYLKLGRLIPDPEEGQERDVTILISSMESTGEELKSSHNAEVG